MRIHTMDVCLVMFKADGSRRDFPIAKPRIVLGRTNTCDLRIPLSSVSRQHCELVIEENAVSVRDMGSSNGTYLNNTRIQEATLEPGDELVVGPVVFTLMVDGRPEKIEPVRSLVSTSAEAAPSDVVTKVDGSAEGLRPLKSSDSGSSIDLEAALESMSDENDDSDELPTLIEDEEKPSST